MDTRGRHLLVEYTGCDVSVLGDVKRVEALMNRAAEAAGTRVEFLHRSDEVEQAIRSALEHGHSASP